MNRSHPADAHKTGFDVTAYERDMPPEMKKLYTKVKSTAEGRKALKRFKKFWGIMPTEIRIVDVPGPRNKTQVVVGMGKAGHGGKILLKNGKTSKAKGAKWVATDADGKQIFLLTGKNSNAGQRELEELGVVEETHYVPTAKQENAGTFKKDAYWVHRHDDEGGKFPRVYRDQAGNYIYDRGTYRVTDWIRR